MSSIERFIEPCFPRSNAYNSDWLLASVSGGANSLWLTEWLTSAIDLKPGMRILDLGCGRAASSIFLAREFGAQVWAMDLWFSPSENLQRIRDAALEDKVFPLRGDSRKLPFAAEFFDAVLSIDAIAYFGTDDHFLSNLARFVKPEGTLAIALAGFTLDMDGNAPSHLADWISAEPSLLSMHSASWWQRHWQKSGVVDVELADSMPNGWKFWLEWLGQIAPDNRLELDALQTDQGRYLTYNRVIARRRAAVNLADPVPNIPASYAHADLLR